MTALLLPWLTRMERPMATMARFLPRHLAMRRYRDMTQAVDLFTNDVDPAVLDTAADTLLQRLRDDALRETGPRV